MIGLIALLGIFLCIFGFISHLHKQDDIDIRVAKLETVLILKGIMPAELAAKGEK